MVDKIDAGEMSIGGVYEEVKRIERQAKREIEIKSVKAGGKKTRVDFVLVNS
jgi:hypothetical protein